jgi:hypothetical protein
VIFRRHPGFCVDWTPVAKDFTALEISDKVDGGPYEVHSHEALLGDFTITLT